MNNAKAKRIKLISLCTVGALLLAAAIVFLPRLLKQSNAATVSTIHTVEAVTVGEVSTTVSGSGTLTPITTETLTAEKDYTVSAVNYSAGSAIKADAVIATLTDGNGNSTELSVDYDCVLLEIPLTAEAEIARGEMLAMVMGQDGFTMGIAVDEQDIASMSVGLEVSFSIDAINETPTGTVTAVSYNGSTSGSTTAYQLTATIEYIEGIYPGMSAEAKIVVESSGEGLLVPVDAVRTSGDDSYLLLAPSDAEQGAEYAEDELDTDTLQQVTVETGMSDGSYILVESEEIKEGTTVIISRRTSSATGSESDNESSFGSDRGPGGSRGPGGMDFGDFDFGNFDPGNMPSGGSFPGGSN